MGLIVRRRRLVVWGEWIGGLRVHGGGFFCGGLELEKDGAFGLEKRVVVVRWTT